MTHTLWLMKVGDPNLREGGEMGGHVYVSGATSGAFRFLQTEEILAFGKRLHSQLSCSHRIVRGRMVKICSRVQFFLARQRPCVPPNLHLFAQPMWHNKQRVRGKLLKALGGVC
ncbi:unnamed protein product [Leuciscus chuanchicus]